jgi:hypothetical protein
MNPRFCRVFWFSVFVLCVSAVPGFGWNSTGHKVVAFIAWDQLTPKTRQAVTDLLKQHPRYDKDLLLDAPADESPDEQARTAFATAATWPDMVRSQNNPMNATHNHPAWHYIDIPYCVGNQKVTEAPPAGPAPHDAIEALIKNTADLKDPAVSPGEKAVSICWIEHLTGDIHQPLHAVSLYSPQFPDGDRGGNMETVLREPPYPDSATKLHTLWDALLGNFQSEELTRSVAAGIAADPRFSREKLKDQLAVTDFMSWAKESHDLAIKYVYLDGTLKSSTAQTHGGRRGGDGGDMIPGVPPGYMISAENLAAHQAAVAGARLADELNKIFDPK